MSGGISTGTTRTGVPAYGRTGVPAYGAELFRLLTGHAPLTKADADALSSAALHGLLKK